MPRVQCTRCPKHVAVMPVAGRPSRGRLWRHDAPGERRAGGALVSCLGSLEVIDMPGPARQMEIPGTDAADRPAEDELGALF